MNLELYSHSLNKFFKRKMGYRNVVVLDTLPCNSKFRAFVASLIFMIIFGDTRQQLRSASWLLVVPRCRLNTTARRAFSVVGPSVWNSVPDYLRDPAVGRDTFRKHLKTFMFNQSINLRLLVACQNASQQLTTVIHVALVQEWCA